MNKRLATVLNVSLLAVSTVLLMPASPTWGDPQSAPPAAEPAEAATTEDIIFTRDGRELHGQIISETRTSIVFEYRDAKLKMTTKVTLSMDDIIKIERDVKVETPAGDGESTATPTSPSSSTPSRSKKGKEEARHVGVRFAQTDDPNVPSLYVVPMKGQMGTDVRAEVYEKVIQDIKLHKPSVVVLDVDCSDTSDLMYPEGYETVSEEERQKEWGLLDFDDYLKIVRMFRDDLDIPQVVWIHDADGIAATVSMAWPKIYMAPDARIGAKYSVLDRTGAKGWQDSDVRAKMMAAWQGNAEGFLVKGGYAAALARAMIDSTPVLSASWRGRQVDWRNDENGSFIVDPSDKRPAYFTAKMAEDFCLSQGTAEDLDDLALLLGHREYRIIEGRQNDLTLGYVEDWRRLYRECEEAFIDYQVALDRVSGEDAVKWLGRAKSSLEKVLNAMEKYKAIEIRIQSDYGPSRIDLENQIETIKDEIQRARRSGGGGGGGRGGGLGAGSGGGRSPG